MRAMPNQLRSSRRIVAQLVPSYTIGDQATRTGRREAAASSEVKRARAMPAKVCRLCLPVACQPALDLGVALILLSIAVAASCPCRAEQPTGPVADKPNVTRLIHQLGDPAFAVRKAATKQLEDLGVEALAELRQASVSQDPEVRLRAMELYTRLRHPTPQQFQAVRTAVWNAFLAGDYEEMARSARRVLAAEKAELADWLWLGHACQLNGNWADAVVVYDIVVRLIDRTPVSSGTEITVPEGTRRFLGPYKGPLNANRCRAILSLNTAMIQLEELNERDGAVKRLEELRTHMESVGHVDEYLTKRLDKMLTGPDQAEAADSRPRHVPKPLRSYLNLNSLFAWSPASPRDIAQHPNGGCKLAELPDGTVLAVWADSAGDIRTCRRAADGKSWSQPKLLPHTTVLPEYSPSMAAGPDGTVHLLFLSKRLWMLDHTGGGKLWYTSTKDGEEWSKLRLVCIPFVVGGWPVSGPHVVPLPGGGLRIFWRNYSCLIKDTKTMAGMRPTPVQGELKDTDPRNPHVTLSADGQYHMVFDNFGRDLRYCNSRDGVTWSEPICLFEQRACNPQMLVVKGQKSLLYEASDGVFLGAVRSSGPDLSLHKHLKISTRNNPLRGARALTTRKGHVLIVVGKRDTWLLQAVAK